MDFSIRAGTGKAGTHPAKKHPKKAAAADPPLLLVYTRHIPLLLRGCVAFTCAAGAERRRQRGKHHHRHHCCCCCAVRAAMLDREMSLLDIVARHPFFSWLRGKRTRATDCADSSCSIQNIHSKRRNSPPRAAPPEDGKEWDRVLPAPVSKLVITAPVSTCSGSTLSRTASWSEATTVGSESEVRTFGRLHSSEGAQDQFTEKSPPPSSHRRQDSFQTGMSYTTAAIPINIPCRLDKSEPNIVLQEAARQSLGEMELRMSLSARASRRGVKLSSEEGHSTYQRSTAVARNVHVASRALVVRGAEEEGEGGDGFGFGSGLATPSSFWRGTPSMRPLDGPSPSNSCGEFEGCYAYYAEPSATPRAAALNRTGNAAAGGGEFDEDRRDVSVGGAEEDENAEGSSIDDSDLMFDLEP